MNIQSLFAAVVFALFPFASSASGTQVPSPGPGSPSTLRIDLFHSGSSDAETFSLDELIVEGTWPGPSSRLTSSEPYGPYAFEVQDLESQQVIYSQDFASIFGEWQTTGEAHEKSRTFHESLRMPMPPKPIRVVISKRDAGQAFQEIWQDIIDPSEARPMTAAKTTVVWNIIESGTPSDKVDLLFLGDGYTASQMEKWHDDARRLVDTLFSYEPFKSRRQDFNVRAIDTPSEASGVAMPSAGVVHETPIGASYDAFGMERYILTFSNKRWRDIASAAPYEYVVIVVNSAKYGGAGIYDLFSTVSADNAYTSYVLVHEFGHHFAGLGDEYYTSSVTYQTDDSRPEPWSPNVTANPASPKWTDLIEPGTPLPTPWPKDEYESLQKETQNRRREMRSSGQPESKIEALFDEERRRVQALLSSAEHAQVVGAFEGANYAATGYYRPQMNCIMFTRDAAGFCRVCTAAIEHMIARQTNPMRLHR